MVVHGPKPCKFIGFGDLHGPKPYKFTGFGDLHGPKPYKFIGFGCKHKLRHTDGARPSPAPAGGGTPLRKCGGEAPHLLEWFPGPPGAAQNT